MADKSYDSRENKHSSAYRYQDVSTGTRKDGIVLKVLKKLLGASK